MSQNCSCKGKPELILMHSFKGVALLLLRCIVLSLGFAYLISFMVDGVVTIAISPTPWPFSAIGQYQPRLNATEAASGLFADFNDFVFFFNCAFPAASRLGTGIGLIAACFWSMHLCPPECRVQRFFVGLFAGALIGFRAMLMVSSSAKAVFFSCILFSIIYAIYMTVADRKPQIQKLPLVKAEL